MCKVPFILCQCSYLFSLQPFARAPFMNLSRPTRKRAPSLKTWVVENHDLGKRHKIWAKLHCPPNFFQLIRQWSELHSDVNKCNLK